MWLPRLTNRRQNNQPRSDKMGAELLAFCIGWLKDYQIFDLYYQLIIYCKEFTITLSSLTIPFLSIARSAATRQSHTLPPAFFSCHCEGTKWLRQSHPLQPASFWLPDFKYKYCKQNWMWLPQLTIAGNNVSLAVTRWEHKFGLI